MELTGEKYSQQKTKVENKIITHKNNIKRYREDISYYSSNIHSSDFNKDKLYPTYKKIDTYIKRFNYSVYTLYQKDSIAKRHLNFYLKCKKLKETHNNKLGK